MWIFSDVFKGPVQQEPALPYRKQRLCRQHARKEPLEHSGAWAVPSQLTIDRWPLCYDIPRRLHPRIVIRLNSSFLVALLASSRGQNPAISTTTI